MLQEPRFTFQWKKCWPKKLVQFLFIFDMIFLMIFSCENNHTAPMGRQNLMSGSCVPDY